MTGPDDGAGNPRPISVAELLAKNGTIGALPASGRRRRRRGNDDAVTVAELTGEIPVIRDGDHPDEFDHSGPGTHARRPNGITRLAERVREESSQANAGGVADQADGEASDYRANTATAFWSEPQPRWPESPAQRRRESAPERSLYPRPARKADRVDFGHGGESADAPEQTAAAEQMSPDPLDDYAQIPVDVMDTEVRDAEPATEDSAYVRSYLRTSVGRLVGGKAGGSLDGGGDESDASAALGALAATTERDEKPAGLGEAEGPSGPGEHVARRVKDAYPLPGPVEAVLRGGAVVLQSILAVAFGAGLFIAFEQLWRWNNIVALVLSVLVILGLVVGVRIVRKTEDIASTLIAVAVGALVTLGPLALLQSR